MSPLKRLSSEFVKFLAWFGIAEERGRIIKTAELGRRIDYIVEQSPTAYLAWLRELESLPEQDRKRYRAEPLIGIIDRLIPVIGNDVRITRSMREDIRARMTAIQDELKQLARSAS